MLINFQLAAIVKEGDEVVLYKVPVTQQLQQNLTEQWFSQLQSFTDGTKNIPEPC